MILIRSLPLSSFSLSSSSFYSLSLSLSLFCWIMFESLLIKFHDWIGFMSLIITSPLPFHFLSSSHLSLSLLSLPFFLYFLYHHLLLSLSITWIESSKVIVILCCYRLYYRSSELEKGCHGECKKKIISDLVVGHPLKTKPRSLFGNRKHK